MMGSWLERMRSQVPTDPFYHEPAAVLSHSDRPFWGQPNSGVDWCEENYLHTHYVAEWWNFLSSVPMVVYGGFGVAALEEASSGLNNFRPFCQNDRLRRAQQQ